MESKVILLNFSTEILTCPIFSLVDITFCQFLQQFVLALVMWSERYPGDLFYENFVSQEEIETVTVEAINCNGPRATKKVILTQFQHMYYLAFLQFSMNMG